ncbi:MAG: phosphotransferase [Anaerolineales bacterium]|nr:phosphotransferase [Anaerolineales bacterium]
MYPIKEEFSKQIEGTFGQDGVEWLRQLPELLEYIAQRWSLELMPPFEPLSYNYVAPCIMPDGSEGVIKLGVPNKELITEIGALGHFEGRGAVLLINADPDSGVLLLERLKPGVHLLDSADDASATYTAADVMGQLWRQAPEQHPLPSVEDWARGLSRLRDRFAGGTGPFPAEVVDHAEGLFEDLIRSMSDPVVLHGDLHHWNILSAERQPWLAIDPKGVIGEPEYEVGAWLRNPFPHILGLSNPRKLIARRVDTFVEMFGFERDRIIGWGTAQAVLAAWWSYEDQGEEWEKWIAIAECIESIE